MENKNTIFVSALLLSLGLIGGGYCIGKGITLAKKPVRAVSVKGLAEKEVKADLGILELNYREIGNDLGQLNQKLQQDYELVAAFLKTEGFDAVELGRTTIRVEDRLANMYNQAPKPDEQRYIVTGGIKVRTSKVDLLQKTIQDADHLLQQGIPLAFDASSINPNPSFYFTKLDAIRPEMLAAATKSARMVAEQFAKDSSSDLGAITRANQGVYQILNKDSGSLNEAGAIDKVVRLVTSIDYELK